jgi:hypothetical protein
MKDAKKILFKARDIIQIPFEFRCSVEIFENDTSNSREILIFNNVDIEEKDLIISSKILNYDLSIKNNLNSESIKQDVKFLINNDDFTKKESLIIIFFAHSNDNGYTLIING